MPTIYRYECDECRAAISSRGTIQFDRAAADAPELSPAEEEAVIAAEWDAWGEAIDAFKAEHAARHGLLS